MKIQQYLRKNYSKEGDSVIARKFGVTRDKIRRLRTQLGLPSFSESSSLKTDMETFHAHEEKQSLNHKYHEAIKVIEELTRERDAAIRLSNNPRKHQIHLSVPRGTGEAVAFLVASDWHLEEEVRIESVNGRNEFNLAIAKYRVDDFFSHGLKLIKKEQGSQQINHVVLALLGDFISGNIHEELLETCKLRPIDAIMLARDWIASGIQFLLNNTTCTFQIVCCVGNHTRITKKVHIAQERGNNLEYFMYHVLKDHFKHDKRVQFIIEDSYHTYLDVFGTTIRFHHGHAIKYGGGVGGLTIPVNKAIAQWNKTRTADLDIFGHWHQQFDGGNFMCNGSIIGYNAFAVFIKAGFESPKQLFFILDKKRGKTGVYPILFGK